MCRLIWIKERFKASVRQGYGSWMETSIDSKLGKAIFLWEGDPIIKIFEDGFTYNSDLVIFYNEIEGLKLLDLHSLMKAQKTPSQLVELTVSTDGGWYVLNVPLLLYTTLSGVLNRILNQRVRPGT